jgi:uncharacterized protein YciI
MRRLIIALVTSLIAAAPLTAAAEPAGSGAHASAFEGGRKAFIMLIRLRGDLYGRWRATGKWPDDPAANAALAGHSAYWRGQLASGRALLAGGMDGDFWDNAAMIVFEATSQAEAEAIVAADPAVKAYVFQAQVRPFTLHWMTDKFAPPAAR